MFSLIIYLLIAAVGFMMAVLYKRTESTAAFFNPDPNRLLKSFTILFVVSLLLTFLASFFTMRALTHSQITEEGNMQYNSMKELMYFVLNFFFLVLMINVNLYSQARKAVAWGAYLLVFSFYALFVIKDAYYLTNYYIVWQKAMQLLTGEIPDFTQRGWTKVGFGFLVTVLNAVVVWWGFRK